MMEHKAFVFDYKTFDRELRPILADALRSGECGQLVSFINSNLDSLRDPYEGEPLDADWESMIETPDAHQYGDFALTKYYDPSADIGLGVAWDSLQKLVVGRSGLVPSPILGSTIGPKKEPFDPGKMGAYFQSAQQVQENQACLSRFATTEKRPDLKMAILMFNAAVRSKAGLYITF